LTTSAPKSASSMPATPPATIRDRSRILTPSSGFTVPRPPRSDGILRHRILMQRVVS
jgi:hypothetical protein